MKYAPLTAASGTILAIVLGGCSGAGSSGSASSGASQATPQQKIALINQAPLDPGMKQRLIEKIQHGAKP